jgi:hypothetical protein
VCGSETDVASVSRRSAVLAGLVLLLAAPTFAIAADPPGAPRKAYRPADVRRANSALLRKSDLIASFAVDPKEAGVPLIPHCPDFPGDRSNVTITGQAKSAFTDGTDAMGSSSLFFKTRSDLDRYWTATVRERFVSCDAELYATTRREGVQAETLFASEIPLGATGAQTAKAFRMITHLSDANAAVDRYQTMVFLRSGRGLTMIRILYFNQPCDCYTGLARLLAQRLIRANRR